MATPIASVDVPASTANLGSGFDCLAAALSLKLRAELHPGNLPGIVLTAHGEGAAEAESAGSDSLVVRAFREGLRAAGGPPGGSAAWRIEVSSMIPAARGLGSSAAAILAGLLLGASAGRLPTTADQLLALAARLEGHPDNVAAALYGGFTLAADGAARRHRAPLPRAGGLDPGPVHRPDREPHRGHARRAARARPAARRGAPRPPAPRCWPRPS